MDRAGKGRQGFILWFVLMSLAMFWMWSLFEGSGFTEVSYSTFLRELEAGNIEQVTITGQQLQGTLRQPGMRLTAQEDSVAYSEFVTYVPSFGDDDLLQTLDEQNVEVVTKPESEFNWWIVLLMGLPFILFLLLGYAFFSRMQSQGQSLFSINKSRAKLYDREQATTMFDDVAGTDGAKEELEEVVTYLSRPEAIEQLGGKVPKGVLLIGPPGTGKTLLARAVAGEAGVPFFSITGSDFMEMFVGVGASRVRDLFKDAKESAPSIIFIDELDSIGRRRGAGLGGGHDEREQTLNQLLSELDGFEPSENVIVMAATNRPDILDPALLRPGRFDRRVTVDLPTQRDRIAILRIHARKKPLSDDVDLEKVARGTPGFSGADLENLLNEAALLAAREQMDRIEPRHVSEAIDKIMMGLARKGLVLTEDERRMLAYHEAGHALVAAVLEHADPVHKVTIVPRGRAMGVTQQLPEREKYIYRKEYMVDRLAVMMGGRAAEDLIFGSATSGAENDLKQVIQLSRKMVLDWGMSDRFQNIAFGGQPEQMFLGEQISQRREYSEDTARKVDGEIEKIIETAYRRAMEMLEKYRSELAKIAERLLEREEMPGDEVIDILGLDRAEAEPDEPVPAGSNGLGDVRGEQITESEKRS